MENRVIIAAAGSGKTTFLVEEALKQTQSVLITTFTDENEAEIRNKFVAIKGYVPKHVTILTWFRFLLHHGVKPYQGTCNPILFNKKISGIVLVNEQSGLKYKMKSGIPVYYNEELEFLKYYFDNNLRIYTDKIAKFVIRANEKSNGEVIDRITRIYSNIYIDEIQDLAGYDLEILKLLFHSNSNIICVGDPRQVTYYTHWERKNEKYGNGKIRDYIGEKCYKNDRIIIEDIRLNSSHRNNKAICDFSSLLFPNIRKTEPCKCPNCHNETIEHQGVFLVKEEETLVYLEKYHPMQLRHSNKVEVDKRFLYHSYGTSKGRTFDRVLIYPTKGICDWLADNQKPLSDPTRAKLYVAITRARYSVAFVVSEKVCRKISSIPVWHN